MRLSVPKSESFIFTIWGLHKNPAKNATGAIPVTAPVEAVPATASVVPIAVMNTDKEFAAGSDSIERSSVHNTCFRAQTSINGYTKIHDTEIWSLG